MGLGLAGVTWMIFGAFTLTLVDIYHDAFMYKPAFDLLHGNLLFRDVHLHYGPLTTFIHAFSLKLFGEQLAVLKYEIVFFYGLVAASLYFLYRHFLPRGWAALAVWFWIMTGPFFFRTGNQGGTMWLWPSVHALFLQLSGACLFIRGFIRKDRTSFFAAGAAVALSFFCRQHTGLVAIVLLSAAGISYARREKNSRFPSAWIGGMASVFLLLGVYLILTGTLLAFLQQNYGLFPQWHKSERHGSFDPLALLSEAIYRNFTSFNSLKAILLTLAVLIPLRAVDRWRLPVHILWALPIVCFAAAFGALFNASTTYQFESSLELGLPYLSRLVAILAFFHFSWRILLGKKYPQPDQPEFAIWATAVLSMACQMELVTWRGYPYFFWAMAPTLGLSFFYVRKLTVPRDAMALTCLSILVTAYSAGVGHRAMPRWRGFDEGVPLVRLESPSVMRGIQVPQNEVADWQTLTTVIEKVVAASPERPFFTLGQQSLFTTLGKVSKNPGRFWFYAGYFNDEEWKSTVEQFIAKERPVLFLGVEPTPITRDELIHKWGYASAAILPTFKYEIFSPAQAADAPR